MRLKYLVLCLITLCFQWSWGQSYPESREKFVKEFQKKITEYGRGEFFDFAKKELPAQLLESNEFPDAYFIEMVRTCNAMEAKRLKVYPEIYNYVYSVSSFVKNKQPEESYRAYQATVDQMLDSRYVKKIKQFVEFSSGFFSNGKIAESSNYAWFYLKGNYSFDFNKGVIVNFDSGNLICRAISSSGKNRGESVDSLVMSGAGGAYDPVLKKWVGSGGRVTWNKVGLNPNETYADLHGYKLSLKSSTIRVDTVDLHSKYFDNPIQGSLTDRALKINREADKVYPQFLSFDRKLEIKNIVTGMDYRGGFAYQGATFFGAGTNKERAQITYKREGSTFMTVAAEQINITPKKVFATRGRFAMYLPNGDSISHPGINFDYILDTKNFQLSRTRKGIGQAPFQDSYHKLDIYVPKISWNEGDDDLYFTFDFATSRDQRLARFESQAYFDERLYDQLQAMEATHPLVGISKYCYKYDEYVLTEGKAATALGKTIDQAKPTLLTLSSLGFINYDSETKIVKVLPKLENFVRAKAGKIDYDNIVFKSDMRPKKIRDFTQAEIEGDGYLNNILLIVKEEEYKYRPKSEKDKFDPKTVSFSRFENNIEFAAKVIEGYYPKEQVLGNPYFQLLLRKAKEKDEALRLKEEFGTMSLSTLAIDLGAVERVLISANKNTMIFPSDSKVTIKENRDFTYSGWTNSGKLETNTQLASFDYEEFKINLEKTNESIFRIRPLQADHGTKGIPMVSSLTGLTGEILIDDPMNRSGNKKEFGNYPQLKSVNKTKIFYNDESIYAGAYDSTRFYYTVDPFNLDSLNTFSEVNWRLEGELVSAGIFPNMREPIKVMPDYSFGFSTKAPESGLEFYGTDAKYKNKIVLSNNGLQGAGTINFVNSTSISKALSFLPDSTVGIAQFTNRPVESGIEFPDVSSDQAFITYIPKQNVLKAKSTPQNDLLMFDKEARLRGTAYVRPKGMSGRGLMTFKNANLISQNFTYDRHDVFADTSSFRLKNESEDLSENALAFKTDNVKSHVSFEERIGQFNSNEGESTVEFPVNQYMAKMDQFKWFMDELTVEMSKKGEADINIDAGVDLVGSNFFSTHPKQDSLNFRAPRAKFDLKRKTIRCDKVEYVDIADARIFPDSSKLIIRKKAKIDKLINAAIVANYVTKYHRFEKAEVEILARRKYKAAGDYPYYDRDSNVTYITMKDIGLDTSYQTRASGKVAADENFKLSPEFDYYGDVAIRAANPLISFSGATRINHNCDKFDKNWMAFTSEIDPKNIQIPVAQEMKDLEGKAISAGIVWRDSPSTDSIALYPTFLSTLVDSKDPLVMTASGLLQYDFGTKEFQIAPEDKLLNRGEKGNYIALHTESCSMNGDGVIDLGMNYGDAVVDAVGVVNYNQNTGKTSMNITARFDMPLDKGAMQDVANRINEVEGLQPMDFSSTTLEQAVVEWDDIKQADKLKEEYVQEGKVKKLPSGLEKSITITGLRLSSYNNDRWQDYKGLITDVESAVLVNIYGKPVMKYVPLKAFFQQTYSGARNDKFNLYINIPGGLDYYMNYEMQKKDGTLKIKTGDKELEAAINEIKEDKRKKRNFKYEMTTQSVLLSKFMALFE